MKIKDIQILEEITDIENDRIDVLVENEDGYNYIISVATPQDLLEEMNQEKANFVRPGCPKIIVKKLTKQSRGFLTHNKMTLDLNSRSIRDLYGK
jgi:hypothetical protein